jgi:LmbE family N-acetylglucosaminyl deacetylase
MNVIVVAPHPDDEAIGCGGAVRVHANEGHRVISVFLTSGEAGGDGVSPQQLMRTREQEAEVAAGVLGIAGLEFLRIPDGLVSGRINDVAATLMRIIERESPEFIYVPHQGEAHPDHQHALLITRRAIPDDPESRPVILTYETWTPLTEHDLTQDISGVMNEKLRAIRCYGSQLSQLPWDDIAHGLNQYRGGLIGGCSYAEIFQLPEARPWALPSSGGSR